MRTGLAFACALVVLVGITACGSGEETATPEAAVETETTQTDYSETVPPTTEAAPTPAEFVHTWNWIEETQDGYKFDTTFSTGTFTRAGDAAQLAGTGTVDEVLGACTTPLNADTDAIAPFQVSVTNRTPGFSSPLGTKIYEPSGAGLKFQQGVPTPLEAVTLYSDGPRCVEMTDALRAWASGGSGIEIEWTDPVEPQAAVGPAQGYLIIRDFFTPTFPAGDPVKLSNAMVDPNAAVRWQDRRSITQLTGPGVIKTPSGRILPWIPLSGKTECRYVQGGFGSDLVCGDSP